MCKCYPTPVPDCPHAVGAERGFTLLELLISLTVISVLMVTALPAFSGLLLNSQRSAAISELVATLNYARAEAITTRQTIVVCKSGLDVNANRSCAGQANGGWEDGWIVFVDQDRDGVRDEDETLLREHAPLSAGATLRGNSKLASSISFTAHGSTSDNGRMVYCDRRGWSDEVRIVVVATTGRIRVTTALLDSNASLGSCLS